jgi:lysozyme family protein
MSQFAPALDFLLDNEDRQRAYAIVPDTGGHAIAGINSASFSEQYAAIAALPQSQRGPAVASFYYEEFWKPLNAGGLSSQDLANRVLDMAVNGGLPEAAKLLQRSINTLTHAATPITVDGHIGAFTLQAANTLDPESLIAAYRAARVALYQEIALAHPEDQKYLAQWVARASQ